MLSKYFLDFYFNPRSHEGSDAITAQELPRLDEFQSTLPRRERHVRPLRCVVVKIYFNPRSHEGSDILGTSEIVAIYIFQSTLPRRERPPMHPQSAAFPFLFQSTLPRRERQSAIMANDVPMDISIHAPTKGATNTKPFLFNVSHISIHAPTKGATRNVRRCGRNTSDFNPRSHEGSDEMMEMRHDRVLNISIHAPTKGATVSRFCTYARRYDFNPRSHEGSDV